MRPMRWSRLLLLSIVFLMLEGLPAQAQTRITDLSPNHWAYQAVKKLVDEGYLELYEDGAFRGNAPVDRYTLARVVAKILTGTGATMPGGKEDLELIRQLSNEFRSELVLLTMKNKELEEKLIKLEEGKLILAEDQTKNLSSINLLSSEAKELQKQVSSIARDILTEKRRIDLLTREFEAQKLTQTRANQNVEALQKEINTLRLEVESDRKTNRIYMILIGVAGLLIGLKL